MRTLIERFVRGESGVTAYGLIAAAALMLIGVGVWVVASTPRVVAPAQINPLEMMANAKDLPTSLAMATSSAMARSGHRDFRVSRPLFGPGPKMKRVAFLRHSEL